MGKTNGKVVVNRNYTIDYNTVLTIPNKTIITT